MNNKGNGLKPRSPQAKNGSSRSTDGRRAPDRQHRPPQPQSVVRQRPPSARPKSMVLTSKRRYHLRVNPAVALSILLFLLILIVSLLFIVQNRNNVSASLPENVPKDNASAVTSADTAPPSAISPTDENFIGPVPVETRPVIPEAEYVTKTAMNIYRGDLILVNSTYPYIFPDDADIQTVYGNKTASYKVSDTIVSLNAAVLSTFNRMMDDFNAAQSYDDVIIVSGYRDFDTQKSVYDSRVETQGAEMAALYVAVPGYSEHHTGMAMDLSIYTDEGVGMALGDVPACSWINENAHKYGFVLRYPDDKISVTGIGYEPWHYRYVGIPHAYIMKTENLCLEEYIQKMYAYTWEGERYSVIDDEGTGWMVYYVKANIETDTKIPVPPNSTYTISGNNIDGYIVAVKK